MAPRRLPEPLLLFRQLQSTGLSLTRRLRTLHHLAHHLDNCLCHIPTQPLRERADFTERDARELLELVNEVVRTQILPLLYRRHIHIVAVEDLPEAQLRWLARYFRRRIYPLLTPLAVDPAHPFPRIAPKHLHLLVTLNAVDHLSRFHHDNELRPLQHFSQEQSFLSTIAVGNQQYDGGAYHYGAEQEVYGLLNLSAVRAKWIHIPPMASSGHAIPCGTASIRHDNPEQYAFVRYEDIVRHFAPSLFVGLELTGIYQFRVLCAEQAPSVALSTLNTPVADRQPFQPKQMPVLHIDIEQDTPPHLVQWLTEHLHATPECVSQLLPPLDLISVAALANELSNTMQHKRIFL